MKLIHKVFASLLAATGVSFPLVALSAEGNITASLIGMGVVLEAIGYESASGMYYNVLSGDEYTVLTYDLVRGYNYSMIAACDDNECRDLDLILYGPDGDRIASARSSETNESVSFLARETGEYYLQVLMLGCDLASCEYGAQLWYQAK